MKATDYIVNKVNRFQEGYVFTYTDFELTVKKPDAIIKALNRMVDSGKLRKLSKGRYYKPKITEFGELKPDTYQVVKDLIEKDGKITGYLTGYSVYNELGLTTQVSNTIQVGVNEERKVISRGMYKIRFIRQKNRITKENIPLLRLLDAIRYIKEIPDTTIENACRQLIRLMKKLNSKKINNINRLALNYPPSARALTGAIIEQAFNEQAALPVYKSLNPATKYKYNISEKTLPNKQKWNIQ